MMTPLIASLMTLLVVAVLILVLGVYPSPMIQWVAGLSTAAF